MGRVIVVLALCAASQLAVADVYQRTEHREGEYGGITPGVINPYQALPKYRIRWKNNRKNAMYWIGYQHQEDGSARIFLQLSQEPTKSLRTAEGDKAILFLENIRPVRGNWWRPINTKHFDGPLLRVVAKRVRRSRKEGRPAGMEIHMSFAKGELQTPTVKVQKLDDGFYYLMMTITR